MSSPPPPRPPEDRVSVPPFHPPGHDCGECNTARDKLAARYLTGTRVQPPRRRHLRYPVLVLLVAVVCFLAGVMFERHVLIPAGFHCVAQDGHKACWTVIH